MTAALWTSLVPADARFAPDEIPVGAHGHHVEYADGSRRLCATSGLWNVPLGYGNPVVADAVDRAMREASYLSLFRTPHRYAMDAADTLVDLAGSDTYSRVVFSTSGGAAIDAAMKLCRQFWAQGGDPSRSIVVGLRGSYHGTMYGSQSLSGDDLLQGVYGVDRRTVRHVAHDDGGEQLTTLLEREGPRVAAVVIEPVLGTGAREVADDFLRRVGELRERHEFLLVADEVATGFARTGPLFASGGWDVPPDLLVLSKALTNGAMAAAALLVGTRIASTFVRGGWTFVHGETQAGTPASAAAVLAVTEEMRRTDVEHTTRVLGEELRVLAAELVADGLVQRVTGRGCFLGLVVEGRAGGSLAREEGSELVRAVAEHGANVQPSPDGVALVPGYGFGADELATLRRALSEGIRRFREGPV
ncbi:MAG: daptide-type RiPP biosynthesis aminotransferase [Actinomycetota bacterium]